MTSRTPESLERGVHIREKLSVAVSRTHKHSTHESRLRRPSPLHHVNVPCGRVSFHALKFILMADLEWESDFEAENLGGKRVLK